ncbi:hypothetical protein BYT27DRAFT_6514747 [Phlegmacium glaucopus]|nr:hypothetical protein BYT27DRAFT_6514747 [Phlegmacium glaucopus]
MCWCQRARCSETTMTNAPLRTIPVESISGKALFSPLFILVLANQLKLLPSFVRPGTYLESFRFESYSLFYLSFLLLLPVIFASCILVVYFSFVMVLDSSSKLFSNTTVAEDFD